MLRLIEELMTEGEKSSLLFFLYIFCSSLLPVFLFAPQYVRGADPVLKLLDQDENVAEELSITKWNTDSVEEFLSENLERL